MSLFSYNLEVKFLLHYVVCHVISQTAFYYICLITYSVGKIIAVRPRVKIVFHNHCWDKIMIQMA